jgi:hypothetical protein
MDSLHRSGHEIDPVRCKMQACWIVPVVIDASTPLDMVDLTFF